MPTRTSGTFTTKLEFTRVQLRKLLQGVAERAYDVGHEDGRTGRPPDRGRVSVSERSVWKIKP